MSEDTTFLLEMILVKVVAIAFVAVIYWSTL